MKEKNLTVMKPVIDPEIFAKADAEIEEKTKKAVGSREVSSIDDVKIIEDVMAKYGFSADDYYFEVERRNILASDFGDSMVVESGSKP